MRANTANEGDLALVYNINNLQGLFQYTNNNWEVAPTGLTATNEYVVDSIFWGANGVEQGTLQVNTDLTTDQVKIKAQVYNDLSYLELDPSVTNLADVFKNSKNLTSVPNFNTSNVTSMTYMFAGCYNLTNIPNFDTSNVTYTNGMFSNCINLIAIPNFNINNVTNMYMMFSNCQNLKEVPNFNTNSVTNIGFMFSNCSSLVNIPNFNTSKVTSMSCTFDNCINLITIPNFNTNNVMDMTFMFRNCHNLVDIPNLNMSKVTSMGLTFQYCFNLSDASIANIVNSLPNANQLSNQYISGIGLNLARFDDDQLRILNNKGYIDAIPQPVGLTYNITYTI